MKKRLINILFAMLFSSSPVAFAEEPLGPNWWSQQERVDSVELSPNEEYGRDNNTAEFRTEVIDYQTDPTLNAVPTGPESRVAINVEAGFDLTVDVPLGAITDGNPGDELQNTYLTNGTVSIFSFDPISRVLTLRYELMEGQTAQVTVLIVDYRDNLPRSSGFIYNIDLTAVLP